MTKKSVPFSRRDYFPADHKLVVMRDKKKTSTAGGLSIPDQAQEKQTFVTVVAVAENLKDKFHVGDRLCYGGFYQMVINDGDDQGLVVLRYPEEVMYKFSDTAGFRPETDEEEKAREEEESAAARLMSGRAGRLVVTDG